MFQKNTIIVILSVLFALAGSASATKLTFDINPTLGDNTDFGLDVFTTVYGDHAAAGSDGSTFLYDGTAADTPNIGIDYGCVLSPEYYEQKWVKVPGVLKFHSNLYGQTNAVRSWGSYNRNVISFDPDQGYATILNSVDVGADSAGVMRIEVWESIGNALDTTTFVQLNRPVFTEGTDYKVLYSNHETGTTLSTINLNIASGKILWLLIDRPVNANQVSVDNIDFDQAAIDTCEKVQLYGMAMDADFSGDCGVNLTDIAALVANWQMNYDPHEIISIGSSNELLIEGVPNFVFGIYGLYPGMTGLSMDAIASEEQWANQSYILDYQANLHRIQGQLDEAAASGTRLMIYPFPRDVYDKIVAATVGASLAPADADMIRDWVNEFKNHKGLLGWYLADEPEGKATPLSWFEEAYQLIKQTDQYGHPVVITNNHVYGVNDYVNAVDVYMPDPYPLPLIANGQSQRGGSLLSYIIPFIDAGVANGKPVWLVPQLFNYAASNASQSNTRAPDFEELRAMIFGSIVHGAKGVVGFGYPYNRVEPENRIGYKYIGREIREIEKSIIIGQDQTASSSDSDIHVLTRQIGTDPNSLVTIAVNVGLSDLTGVTITQLKQNGTLYVLSEDRTVTVTAGSFTDDFGWDTNNVHIYTTNQHLTTELIDIRTEINAEIAYVNAQNEGNLVYQGLGTLMTRDYSHRIYLADGYRVSDPADPNDDDILDSAGANYIFNPDGADFIEFTLDDPATITDVTIHSKSPYYQTQRLENYTIKLYSDSQGWQTVASETANVDTIINVEASLMAAYDDVSIVRLEGAPAGSRAVSEFCVSSGGGGFRENFDLRATGTVLDKTAIGAHWLSGLDGNIVEVVDSASTPAVPFGGAGNKALHMVDASAYEADGVTKINAPSVQYRGENLVQGTFAFDFMVVGGDSEMLYGRLYQANTYSILFNADNNVFYYNDGSSHAFDQAILVDQQHSVVFNFDCVTDTFTGTLDGATLTTGGGAVSTFDFRVPVDYISDVTFSPGYQGYHLSDVYLDNIAITP